MKSRLVNLYSLQIIDSQLDELEELKGDLPTAVRTLEAKLDELKQQRHDLEQSMKQAFAARDEADSSIVGLRTKLEKFKTQQYSVRTNREYDALTREMDSAADTITKLEAEMETQEGKASQAKSDIEEMGPKIEDLQAQLKEKRGALAEVSKSTEEEELKLNHQRQKFVARVGKADVTAYERIRKARNGKAVVPVRKGSCGGCFNRVPPQKLLELRQNAKLYKCERCGRIIISDEVAETVTKGT